MLRPISGNSALLIAVGISAAAIKIPGLTNHAVLEIELVAKSRIAKIAEIVTNVVSVNREILNRFNPLVKSGTDSAVGGELAILSWPD